MLDNPCGNYSELKSYDQVKVTSAFSVSLKLQQLITVLLKPKISCPSQA